MTPFPFCSTRISKVGKCALRSLPTLDPYVFLGAPNCFIADTFSSLTPSRLTFTCPVSCTIFDLRVQSVTDSGFRHWQLCTYYWSKITRFKKKNLFIRWLLMLFNLIFQTSEQFFRNPCDCARLLDILYKFCA